MRKRFEDWLATDGPIWAFVTGAIAIIILAGF